MIGTHWIENGRVKKNLKALKEGKCDHGGQKLEIHVASKLKLQQRSRTNKQRKPGRYFTIQTVRQNMPFIIWSAQYKTCSMSVRTRYHSTLD